jgi:DNA-binding MarR family transcriptional regulator
VSRENKITISTSPSVSGEPSDDEIRMQINLRLKLDEVAEEEANQLRASARRMPNGKELCRLACRIYDNRRARDKIINRKLFGEPAWDMLLALYCLPTRGEIMTVTSLSLAACVPQATGIRWQGTLTNEGLIERGPQGVDKRKQFIRLTPAGRTLMDRYLTHLFYCDTPMPEHADRAGG